MAASPDKPLDQAEAVRMVSIAVPARADAVQVVRTVVGSVASRMGFPYDQVDDLRLATSEVVAHLLEEQPPPDSLVVKVVEQDGAIEVEASRTSPTNTWPPSGARHSLTTLILRALADEASFDRSEHGPAIRFMKRYDAGPSPVS
jgi:anti-sigma regulatory factor (Ser/Thr protein kinase)